MEQGFALLLKESGLGILFYTPLRGTQDSELRASWMHTPETGTEHKNGALGRRFFTGLYETEAPN